MAQTTPSGLADSKPTSTNSDTESLNDQIKNLREDLSSLAELVGEIGSRRGKEAKARFEAKAGETRAKGEDMLHEAGRRYADYEDQAIDQIRSNPFQAVGIAAAAGFLLGYLNSRR
ncbi:hypothetical protein GCM10011415_09530 [Salipiger pallidus]|uniref:DUF883 domain-containing protein n=1 Tax=Salipiger pallidus TaxID=1775170 RepID=A0A8J2ZHS9_9RHOB|nr:DUF883 family protein [Salipiger pallidus]GGG64904.1 hypothetical protein GCM10011415_09530 [Salipiger pallidus]